MERGQQHLHDVGDVDVIDWDWSCYDGTESLVTAGPARTRLPQQSSIEKTCGDVWTLQTAIHQPYTDCRKTRRRLQRSALWISLTFVLCILILWNSVYLSWLGTIDLPIISYAQETLRWSPSVPPLDGSTCPEPMPMPNVSRMLQYRCH